ncbi:hypothetical protein NX059_011073 [Plenodomus lindquistii]|nr:hypothetical protein NX059_011073 [Plenodomus lindquistii]
MAALRTESVAEPADIKRAFEVNCEAQYRTDFREYSIALAMSVAMKASIAILATSLCMTLVTAAPTATSRCRYLPGDPQWPSDGDWSALNRTVGGNLIRGVPLAQSACYGRTADAAVCTKLQSGWMDMEQFTVDPVNTMSLYGNNNSCNPLAGPFSTDPELKNVQCTLGNLAQYAIKVTDASSAIAGVKFAKQKNIRLTVKNTGHDYLGRSMGRGSLALWTHNLKEASFFQYKSKSYSGPAGRIGAGVQVAELYQAAAAAGYRAVGGSCPSVGAGGGWTQGGGHGPLSAAYGLGADQTLEFDVVTPEGKRVTASPAENADLYYALSGGGAGNFGVVLAMTVKVHKDGPVAGARLTFTHTDTSVFMQGVRAWIEHTQVLDTIAGFRSDVRINQRSFSLAMATLPDADASQVTAALAPFYDRLRELNITVLTNETTDHDNFVGHYNYYTSGDVYARNVNVGNRLVSRAFVRNASKVSQLVATMQDLLSKPNALVIILGTNVTHARVGNKPGSNAVSQDWRNSLFLVNVGLIGDPEADWPELQAELAAINSMQDRLRTLDPDSGAYQNEATFDNPNWREDYYGDAYSKLLQAKRKYDSQNVMWNRPAVGSDALVLRGDGRLCAA